MINKQEDWEKEFDKQFPYDTFVSAHQDWIYNEVKSFIFHLLQSYQNNLAEEIEKMKVKTNCENCGQCLPMTKIDGDNATGYNQALDDIIKYLNREGK